MKRTVGLLSLVVATTGCMESPDTGHVAELGSSASGLTRATMSAPEVCTGSAEVLIVFDRSASMSMWIGRDRKLTLAREAIFAVTRPVVDQLDFGLLPFPNPGSCDVSGVTLPVGRHSWPVVRNAVPERAGGKTPLGQVLRKAHDYLAARPTTKQKFVLLVTDGKERCGGRPTAAARALRASGILTYVIGFGSDVNPDELASIAKEGGTEKYHQADDLTQLIQALGGIVENITCCGDRIVQTEQGEICDTAIPKGMPGACTVVCRDNDPCTDDFSFDCRTCQHEVSTQCDDICGNGRVDPNNNESCDIAILEGDPGACPTRCNDGDPCTHDQLAGEQCRATCVFEPIPGCVKGCGNGIKDFNEACDIAIAPGRRGACPTHCESRDPCVTSTLVGSDCEARCQLRGIRGCVGGCGNGKVESYETCDTAIPTGEPGACPTECADDGDSCTYDWLSGSGCRVECRHDPLPGCVGGCGNGELDTGEQCDIGIPVGRPGACPSDCEDNDPCTIDRRVGERCDQTCSNQPIDECDGGCGNHVVDYDLGETCDVAIERGEPGACPIDCFTDDLCTEGRLDGPPCSPRCVFTPYPNCSAGCGNGRIDVATNETCDIAIAEGKEGACPTDCDDGDVCTIDRLEGDGCNATCVHEPVPIDPIDVKIVSLADDVGNPTARDIDLSCILPCAKVQCQRGFSCLRGECVPWLADPIRHAGPHTDPATYHIGGGCNLSRPVEGPFWLLLLVLFLRSARGYRSASVRS